MDSEKERPDKGFYFSPIFDYGYRTGTGASKMQAIMIRYFPSLLCLLLLASLPACGQNRYEINRLEYSNPVNTESRSVELQQKRRYDFGKKALAVDNLFEGARLNGVSLTGSTLKVFISPENIPINGSSWYAFRIRSRKKQTITIELNYSHSTHRYQPKWSRDGKNWSAIDDKNVKLSKTGNKASFTILLTAGNTWIAAQEIIDSKAVLSWCVRMQRLDGPLVIENHVAGQSAMEKDIPCLDIYSGEKKRKPVIVIFGRQHPPEVTGHLALKAFVERMLKHEQANEFFKKYRVVVFPIINPDGVDLGHWRHNAQGIDLNRDYAAYQQPEIKAVTQFLIKTVNEDKARIIMGLDFHSTYEDVYYTNLETEGVELAGLENEWLKAIRKGLSSYSYDPKSEQHSVQSNPSAQHWFYRQFRALGITYEIGDNTERSFIKEKAKVSADALMNLLMKE